MSAKQHEIDRLRKMREEVATLDTRGGVEVLHGVSLRAEPGRLVALVGSSGAGKSTIAQLVSRLIASEKLERAFTKSFRSR